MRLPRLAIENHQFTTIIIALLVLSGAVSFITMPRSEDPEVSPPGTTVIIVYPGATPEDIEEVIVDPVEKAINELEDIKEINGYASDGLAIVDVEFDSGSDADEKYSDVIQKVNSIRTELPTGIVSLDMEKWSVNLVNILQLAIISETATYRELERELEILEKRIQRTTGVRTVETWAYPDQQVRVSVDLGKMAQFHIPLIRVFGAIQSANANIPGGNIDIGRRRFTLQTSGSYDSVEDIANTVVHAVDEGIVHLKDIADVRLAYDDETYRARFNGERAVFLTVTQKAGTNIFSVMDRLKTEIADFHERLPSHMRMETVFDQSESVAIRLDGFFMNLLQGLLLVGLIVFLSVNVRSSAIVMLAIPFSILIGLGFVDLTGYGLQQMSIAGLVIALGLLVDNAIVVTENISRFMRMGYGPREAAWEGTSQVGWAVVSATATTVLAFVPIMMMRDVTGDFIRSMPATVVYTLSASLLLSLTLTPYLSSKFIRTTAESGRGRVRRLLKHFIETRYRHTLDYAIRHPRRVIALALAVLLGCLALFPVVGVSYFPKAEKPQFIVNIDAPKGTSIDRTDEMARQVEAAISKRGEIKSYTTNIGHGNPRVYYNMWPRQEAPGYAQIFVELRENDMKVLERTVRDLRQAFSDFAGAKIEVKEFEQGPPVQAPIAIVVIGDNLEMLELIARDVEGMIARAPGTTNISNPLGTSKTDLRVNINRAKAGMLGINLSDIDVAVRAAIAGLPVSQYNDEQGKEYDIVVRLPLAGRPAVTDLGRVYVSSITGAQVPLRQVASVEFTAAPMSIDHFNLERSVTITADVVRDASVDEATRRVIRDLEAYSWPRGYRYYIAGELESREESFGGMGRAVAIALVAILAVLVLQFRSYTQPLIVFAAIPLAIIGSILALLITRNSFSFTAFIGLTSLVGIVINNSIILVDYTNRLRTDGKDLIAALKEAGETRFIPIVLTTATTVGGLLPLTLGGGTMWAPMGWTIIGGLICSTFLTLIIVPVLYKLFTRNHRRAPK
jgi:multidrug efflux pump subunit AcrB